MTPPPQRVLDYEQRSRKTHLFGTGRGAHQPRPANAYFSVIAVLEP